MWCWMATKLLYLKGLAFVMRALIGLVKELAAFVDLRFVFDWLRRLLRSVN